MDLTSGHDGVAPLGEERHLRAAVVGLLIAAILLAASTVPAAMTFTNPSQNGRLVFGAIVALDLVAAALALVLGGYCFGREDHSTYLPMMWHIQDATLFQGDLLIESAGESGISVAGLQSQKPRNRWTTPRLLCSGEPW